MDWTTAYIDVFTIADGYAREYGTAEDHEMKEYAFEVGCIVLCSLQVLLSPNVLVTYAPN